MKTETMNKKKQPMLVFICIIVIMSFFFEWIYIILVRKEEVNILDILIDLPFIMLMAFISLLVVHSTNKRFRYKNNIYIRVVFELVITSSFAAIYTFIVQYLVKTEPAADSGAYLEPAIVFLLGNNIIVLMLELFFYNQRQAKADTHIAVIEKERAEYLYATLKAQINPHFLFNSLNVLSSLTFESPEKANIYTKKLSNIYRYVLSTNAVERIELKEEIDFLKSYIYLLSIRFENTLVININGDENSQRYIIPVSLQLLLENAMKHNIATKEQPLTVDINIGPECVTVINNIQLRINPEKSGHGLDNLQKQYHMHNKSIKIDSTDSLFIVRIPYL